VAKLEDPVPYKYRAGDGSNWIQRGGTTSNLLECMHIYGAQNLFSLLVRNIECYYVMEGVVGYQTSQSGIFPLTTENVRFYGLIYSRDLGT
jgi:hypothetical protein